MRPDHSEKVGSDQVSVGRDELVRALIISREDVYEAGGANEELIPGYLKDVLSFLGRLGISLTDEEKVLTLSWIGGDTVEYKAVAKGIGYNGNWTEIIEAQLSVIAECPGQDDPTDIAERLWLAMEVAPGFDTMGDAVGRTIAASLRAVESANMADHIGYLSASLFKYGWVARTISETTRWYPEPTTTETLQDLADAADKE